MICYCDHVRNEMIAAGAVKTFFELVGDPSNELMQTLCTMTIDTLLTDANAVRKASKFRAAETMLQVLSQHADSQFWEQRSVVLSICSRLLFNRSCGLVFVYGGLMCVARCGQVAFGSQHDGPGTLSLNFIPKRLEWYSACARAPALGSRSLNSLAAGLELFILRTLLPAVSSAPAVVLDEPRRRVLGTESHKLRLIPYFYKLEMHLESFAYTRKRANILATRNPFDVGVEVGRCSTL